MNEMHVRGWLYMDTNATEDDKALEEFRAACEKVGINADNIYDIVLLRKGEKEYDYDSWRINV